MSRPRPLQLASGTPTSSNYQNLTPRTPHSRSGRAEEAFSEIELDDIHEVDEDYTSQQQQQQSKPLLTSTQGGYRSRGDEYDARHTGRKGGKRWTFARAVSLMPLVLGGLTAGLLIFLVFASYQRPETLHRILGAAMPTEETSQDSVIPEADLVISSDSPLPLPTPSLGHSTTTLGHDDASRLLSYEGYTNFPLRPNEYREECDKLNKGFMHHGGKYWDVPPHGPVDVAHDSNNKVCKSTVTYMLDGKVGLLADLALMAQVAALARERNRTFFVDDTYWNRGKWKDHFVDVRESQPGIEPGCLPPPPNELVACPRSARHWVVNSRTAKYHLGHPFSDTYEDPYGHGLRRLKPIFDMARESFAKTIRPNEESKQLIREAQEEFSMILASSLEKDEPYIGVHIRRGDRKATSWEYHASYVPISEYVRAVADTWNRIGQTDTSRPEDTIPQSPYIYLASDSPGAQTEFGSSIHQEKIFSLARSQKSQLRALASFRDYDQKEFDGLTLSERVAATKGMIIDFAMVSGMWSEDTRFAPQAIICTITSSVCRMSAVAFGWTRAFGELDSMGNIDETGKHWIEIDEKGHVTPIWQAFELFR